MLPIQTVPCTDRTPNKTNRHCQACPKGNERNGRYCGQSVNVVHRMLAAATRLAWAVARGRNAEMTRSTDDEKARRASLDLPSAGNIIDADKNIRRHLLGFPCFSHEALIFWRQIKLG